MQLDDRDIKEGETLARYAANRDSVNDFNAWTRENVESALMDLAEAKERIEELKGQIYELKEEIQKLEEGQQ